MLDGLDHQVLPRILRSGVHPVPLPTGHRGEKTNRNTRVVRPQIALNPVPRRRTTALGPQLAPVERDERRHVVRPTNGPLTEPRAISFQALLCRVVKEVGEAFAINRELELDHLDHVGSMRRPTWVGISPIELASVRPSHQIIGNEVRRASVVREPSERTDAGGQLFVRCEKSVHTPAKRDTLGELTKQSHSRRQNPDLRGG